MAAGGGLLYEAAMKVPETRGDGDLAALLADPDWLPHRILGGNAVQFAYLPRSERSALPFLDERFVSDGAPRAEVPLERLAGALPEARGECHFIFHSAFCCSTLLGRALGADGGATVLQEPRALTDLSAALPGPEGHEEAKPAIDCVLALLQRPHRPGEAVIVKPSNFANPLIEDLLDLRPTSRALLMYAKLPDFLLAIVRRGSANREWARRMATLFRRHPQIETAEGRDLLLLTDLQAAAWVWLHHQAQFARLVREQPAGRVATLEMGAFLADPAGTLIGAAALFGIGMDEARAAEIAAGRAFRHHSKRPERAFDPAVLKREEAAAKFAYGAEIDLAVQWAAALAARSGVPLTLEAALRVRP
ncbi:MAG TPA: hypothetical protein VF619_03000 [Allosphingosinicella sp.]|jgi:hypothetical protein